MRWAAPWPPEIHCYMPRGSKLSTERVRPSRGRPPGPPGRVRPHRVVTFVTDTEIAKLEQICRKEMKSLSAVTHEILSRSLRRRERSRHRASDNGGLNE